MVAERFGQRPPAAHLFVDVVEHAAKNAVGHLAPQQIYRLHKRHSSLEQRGKFLVEDEKFVAGDFPALRKEVTAGQGGPLPQRKYVKPLRFELVPQTCFVFRRVGTFDDLARGSNQPTAKFHAKWLKL